MNGTPSWGLVLVRIVVGFLLMLSGWQHLQAGGDLAIVTHTREAYAAGGEFMRTIGRDVVLAHATAFDRAIVLVELLCGVGLFLGLLTRPAGFVAALLFTAAVFLLPAEQRATCALLAACCFACGLSRAGLRSGADVFLEDRLPAWLTWTRSSGASTDD